MLFNHIIFFIMKADIMELSSYNGVNLLFFIDSFA